MKKIRIIADSHIPFLEGMLESYAEIAYLPGGEITAEKAKTADALLIRTRTKIYEALLKGSSVKMIASATIGLDHVDAEYCRNAGISVFNVPGCNANSVANYVIAGILHYAVKNKVSLKNKTIGIIGVGNVGKQVAVFAKALGLRVLQNDPPREDIEGSTDFLPLPFLLQQSDIISIHVPLNHAAKYSTFGMVNENFAANIKPGALFINTSRGETVNDDVLINLLETEKLSGAILDVWNNEPALNTLLANLALIATPHIAGYSINGKAAATLGVVKHVLNYFDIKTIAEPFIKLPETTKNSQITLQHTENNSELFINEAISYCYNISGDNANLKDNLADFESLRNNYPIRHEFQNYRIANSVQSVELKNTLQQLGFNF